MKNKNSNDLTHGQWKYSKEEANIAFDKFYYKRQVVMFRSLHVFALFFWLIQNNFTWIYTGYSIMGLDPDYNVRCKKSDSENIYIWDLERIWLPVLDCFVFDKAMQEIPYLYTMYDHVE